MRELYASRVKDFETIDTKFSSKVTSNVIELSKDNLEKNYLTMNLSIISYSKPRRFTIDLLHQRIFYGLYMVL